MKFLITLMMFNFLCVWCFGFEDCEGDDIICEEILPVPAFLPDLIAYANEEPVKFMTEGLPGVIEGVAFRSELEAGGQSCSDIVFSSLSISSAGEDISFSVATEVEFFTGINITVRLSEQERLTSIGLEADAAGVVSAIPPATLRRLSDTTIAGTGYQDVLVFDLPDAGTVGEIRTLLYNASDGLLLLERTNRATLFRVE